ncbi:MAG: hypothetical protein KFF50_17835 [Desulfatitalea sp.]|nr:hypothetical protein [Desulfatitalea sp.]
MKKYHRSNNPWAIVRVAIVLALLLPLLSGCAHQYGELQWDGEVTRMFRTNSVPETYRYYTDGRADMPYAIVGIDPGVQLVPRYWEPVAPHSEAFARKVASIWLPEDWTRYPSGQGAFIVDRTGKRIGIWYSMYAYTTIAVHEDGRVDIYSPAVTDGSELE